MDTPYLIRTHAVTKDYSTGASTVQVLRGVDLEIHQGEAVCLLGSSGAGKSTLLQILGTLDRPTQGEVYFEGHSLFAKSDDELAFFRNETMGFVFQFHHLIKELTALENVMLPAMLANMPLEETKERALHWLSFMGLSHRSEHYPNQLSGGELQRVAIARALIRNPRILLADEPTGNLDSENSIKVQNLFFELQKQLGLTLVVVTHDLQFAQQFSKIYRMKDGRLTSN
ncbi:MAG: ABC transporter ATP-binding protein [Pseudobdellovibrio sp.]